MPFTIHSPFQPTEDQKKAADKLSTNILNGQKGQVLLGVTGSGKTYTIAQVIEKTQLPTLLISHNKTLAGQLYQEMRDFFPTNGISYFVSYYDYYQPEAYIPSSDTYIEKEAQINDVIDKLRLATTSNIMTRKDVVVVASVSCIYNLGSPQEYSNFVLPLAKDQKISTSEIMTRLVELQYERSEFDYRRATFRLRGQHLDIYPAYDDISYRLTIDFDTITHISSKNPLTGETIEDDIQSLALYPAKHYLIEKDVFKRVAHNIEADLAKGVAQLQAKGRALEADRLLKKVTYDLEMMREMGYVNGIENYSTYFDGRKPGEPPYSLLDYFQHQYGDDWLLVIDESHMTVPQIRGMHNGDASRKRTLIDYGFRMESALDNRPLRFEEFYERVSQAIYVSATPSDWEMQEAKGEVVQQLVRPTGIVDPLITIKPTDGDIPDLIKEIQKRVKKGQRVLVTTLTKRTAEDLTTFLKEKAVKAVYLHSDIKTLERTDILQKLRKKEYDVLIGVNLLREGLDLPEVTLVAILDGDKAGFLRSRTALIQTMGRAARNVEGEVIMYADTMTIAMKEAIEEVGRRREYQLAYNKTHNINPTTIIKEIREDIVQQEYKEVDYGIAIATEGMSNENLTPADRKKAVSYLEKEMRKYADMLDFETAIMLREKVQELSKDKE